MAQVAPLPPGRVFLVDNVATSGATLEGARRVLDVPTEAGLVYARAEDVTLPPATQTNPPSALARVRRAVGRGRECYPAAEVVYHANGGKAAGYTPMQQVHEGASHWWVRGPGGQVLDPAAAQFRTPVPYKRGRGRGFLTKRPSRRAKALAKRAKVKLNPPTVRKRLDLTGDRPLTKAEARKLARWWSGRPRTSVELVRVAPNRFRVIATTFKARRNPPNCQIVPLSEDADWDAIEEVTDRDVYEIMDEAERLFDASGIRISSVEKLHEACLGPDGRVLGASVVGLETTEPYEWDDQQRPRYVFSISVLEEARRQGIARALVESLMDGLPSDEVMLEGKVVNPHMAVLLGKLGFLYHDEPEDEDEWSDWERQVGRGMFRPNPRPPKPISTRVIRDDHDLVLFVYIGKAKVGHLQAFRVRRPAEDLRPDCLRDLRQIQGARPGITAYVVWKSHVTERYRKRGAGRALYEATLAHLRAKHDPAAVALVPMRCLTYGSTSDDARRVWSSLARSRPHASELAVLANPAHSPLLSLLESLRPQLAAAANEALADHEWEGGGACDLVAQYMHGVLADAHLGVLEGGQDGDDHAWLIAHHDHPEEAYAVDVPPGVYETGGGYAWEQIPGAQVAPQDLVFWPVEYGLIRERIEDEWD